jgi:DNA primase
MAATQPIGPVPARHGAGSDPRRLLAAHDAAAMFYRAHLGRADGPRRYLAGRGLGVLADREWPWRVGYAPAGWNILTRHLRSGGFTRDELLDAGLSARTRDDPDRLIDIFRDRVMFPVRAPAGQVVAFIGRAGPGAGGDVPKYLNSPETAIYTKGSLLFGVAEQQDRLRAGWTPVLVEGPADTIAVWLSYARSGGAGCVAAAPCGTALTETQAAILRDLPGAGRGVVVAFDGDAGGHRAAERAWQLLRRPTPPGPLLAAEFAAGADPADLLRQPDGRPALRAALRRRARPLLEAVVDHRLDRMLARHPRLLEDIGGRWVAVRALTPLLFEAGTPAEAARLAAHVAERTGAGPQLVLDVAVDHVEELVDQVANEVDQRLAAVAPRRPPPAAAFPAMRTVAGRPPSSAPVGPAPPAAARPARGR